ncbi:hypothetical protein WJX72_000303 [[Myrmecia] bisecta]|uniref:Rieske domain-containing protein n=1 Tax=[Myrmecia] bisecta TaxID=41462 RepID=A0AAW1PSZ3_9CHLO
MLMQAPAVFTTHRGNTLPLTQLNIRGRSCNQSVSLHKQRSRVQVRASTDISTANRGPAASTSSATDKYVRPEAAQQPVHMSETFSWTKQWYPVAVAGDLDTSRPTAIKLLGRSLVLWRDADKQWRCFEDRCPHRLAPLSEGRIEPSDGTLMCSYHGWRFDGRGSCSKLPQAASRESEAKACQSPRACAVAYPTQVLQRLVWVWGEAGPQAEAESRQTAAATVPELLKAGDAVFVADWFMRDVPYGFDVLAENVLDPSHVPFAHHGILGKRDKPEHAKAQLSNGNGAASSRHTAAQLQKGAAGSGEPGNMRNVNQLFWEPPCLVRYIFGGQVSMVSYAVPSAPGQSRLLFCMFAPSATAPWYLKLAAFQSVGPFRFLSHFGQHEVLDGDSILIHVQDHELHRSRADWSKRYYLPTAMDTAVVGLRRWLADKAGGGPEWPEGAEWAPQDMRREVLLDRYNQHTKHCPSCSQALRVFTALQTLAAAACALLLVAAAARLGAGRAQLVSWSMAALGGAALALAAVARALHRLCRKFVFVDYVHAEH